MTATDLALVVVLLAAAAVAQRLLRGLRILDDGALGGPGAPEPGSPRVSVVVPARDEAESLPALLRGLADLSGGPVEVVVVDDASRDATAAVARAGGARVVPAGHPPDGWTGKAWACQVGARAATGDVLLFLDADTVLGPDALTALLRLHAEERGLVSVQPYHRVVEPYEQLSAYFNLVPLLASAAFTGRPARRAMAFGPCLLTSRADYERAGGHATVRGEILDDAGLAAAYRRAGLPVTCAAGGRAVQMRSYPGGLRQLASGWTKNVASGATAADPVATAGAVLWVGAHHAVAVGAVVSLLEAATGWGGSLAHGHAAVWAAGWVGFAAQLRVLLRRVGSFRWWTWALFPLPLLAFDVLFARSATHTVVRRSVLWRGREVDLRRGSSKEAA